MPGVAPYKDGAVGERGLEPLSPESPNQSDTPYMTCAFGVSPGSPRMESARRHPAQLLIFGTLLSS